MPSQMSNMFLGTGSAMAKSSPAPAASQATQQAAPTTLEELDKPENCPESVDLFYWDVLCRLRRQKVESEQKIAALATEMIETEEASLGRRQSRIMNDGIVQAVGEREDSAAKTAGAVLKAKERLRDWRREKNYASNNLEVVLTLPRGQVEIGAQQQQEEAGSGSALPNLDGAALLTEGIVTKLNDEIAVRIAFLSGNLSVTN